MMESAFDSSVMHEEESMLMDPILRYYVFFVAEIDELSTEQQQYLLRE